MATSINQTLNNPFISSGGGGSMVYPSSGIANSNGSAWGTSYSTTGTGTTLALSDSPVFTGNVNANVNLRSGLLSGLLQLAGGASEIGYATDSTALVKFNGSAGQAKLFGISSNGTTLNYLLTAANATAVIDCTNISFLNITIDPNYSGTLSNINLLMPATSGYLTSILNTIPMLTVSISAMSLGTFNSPLTFTLSYQSSDISNGLNTYSPIGGDGGGTIPTFRTIAASGQAFNGAIITFVAANAQVGGWTRYPIPGEAVNLGYTSPQGSIGEAPVATNTARSLTSGTVSNSSTLALTPGVWLVSGNVSITTSVGLVATSLSAAAGLAATTTSPGNTISTATTQVNGAIGTTLLMPLPVQLVKTATSKTIYGNLLATFSTGTITATVYQTAIRIA